MTKLRGDPKGITEPALKKSVVISTHRGQLIASSWPRPRGKPKNPITQEQNSWLKWSARVFPYVASVQMCNAITATKGTGLYPRDLITMAMKAKLYSVVLEDGTEIKGREETMEKLMFNGARLELDLNAAIPGAGSLVPTWPLPIVDTFSFWNAANPGRLTVPTGVQVIQMVAGGVVSGAPATRVILSILDKNGSAVAQSGVTTGGTITNTVSTGPLPVMGGDYFEASYFADLARTLNAGVATFFNVQVLQAICPPPV